MLVLRTSNFQGATIRPIAPRHKNSIVFIVLTLNFLPRAGLKIMFKCFQLFKMKAVKSYVKFEKENKQKPS